MIIKRSLPYTPPNKKDIRPYLEKFPKNKCPICKKRDVGGKTVPGSDVKVCDVCHSKHNSELKLSSPRVYITYIEDLCTLSSYVTDTDKIQPGEEILGTVLYSEDEYITPTEKLSDVSSKGVYIIPFELRFIYTKLNRGYLVTEANEKISFVIPAEEVSFDGLIPNKLIDHPEYIQLYPTRRFANKITEEDILANTI